MPSGSSKSKRAKAKRSLNPRGFSSKKIEAISFVEIKECVFDIVNQIVQESSIIEEDEYFELPIVDDTTAESTDVDVFDLIVESCTDVYHILIYIYSNIFSRSL
jgi:hypothetical protein